MNIDNLVKMVNQIGQYFESMPNREQACFGIADHIKKSWTPLMRQELMQHIRQTSDSGVMPIVLESLLNDGNNPKEI